MGWYGIQGATKERTVESIMEDYFSEPGSFIDYALTNNGTNLWVLLSEREFDGKMHPPSIQMFRIEYNKGWLYKPMHESVGPRYYDCPKRFIERAGPPVNDWSKNWREKVMAQ